MGNWPWLLHGGLSVCLPALAIFAAPGKTGAGGAPPDAELFKGYWTVKEEAGDTCFIVVKPKGKASCFWSARGADRILKGGWWLAGDRLVLHWENGYRDVLEKNGKVMMRLTYPPGTSIHNPPAHKIHAKRMDEQMAGIYAVDTPAEHAENRREDMANGKKQPLRGEFIGFWKIARPDKPFYLKIGRGGQALAALRGERAPRNAREGQWARQGKDVIITWPGGNKDVLRKNAKGYTLLAYDKIERNAPPGARRELLREMEAIKTPGGEARSLFGSGNIRFFTPGHFLGLWVASKEDGSYFFIKFERYGEAVRIEKNEDMEIRETFGRWKILHEGAAVTWKDGAGYLVRLTDAGFVLSIFPPGVPATGVPVRQTILRRWE